MTASTTTRAPASARCGSTASRTEIGANRFAADLSSVAFAEGGRLDFTEWSAREENSDYGLLKSRYRQPFGTFAGELPGGLALEEGYGVMEDHDVRW